MKKFFALACSAVLMAGFVSCGPSEEERKQDSTDVAKTAVSMNNEADSIIAAMNEQNKQDSIASAKAADSTHKADSMANAKSKKK
jgi:hypothetical protein